MVQDSLMHSHSHSHTHTHTHTHIPPQSGIQSTVRASMEESLFQILSPKRRINILRDVMAREKGGRPYTITFCGVNGVGKSTNLAKVCVCGGGGELGGVRSEGACMLVLWMCVSGSQTAKDYAGTLQPLVGYLHAQNFIICVL